MQNTYHKLALTILTLTLFVANNLMSVFAANESEAKSAITITEEKIAQCYMAVKEAEKAGANVTLLLFKLNSAGELLSKAKIAHLQGDYKSAIDFSNESQNMLNGFAREAEEAKKKAEEAKRLDFMINYIGSGLGAPAIIICGFLLWTYLKKRENMNEH